MDELKRLAFRVITEYRAKEHTEGKLQVTTVDDIIEYYRKQNEVNEEEDAE